MYNPVSFIPEWVHSDKNESVWLANVEQRLTVSLVNVSKTPYFNFVLSPSATQEIRSLSFPWVLCHTHVDPHSLIGFSVEDNLQISKLPNIGHFVYHKLSGKYSFYLSAELETKAPYLGREWDWSCRNCYTLVQSWYLRELGVKLPNTFLENETVYKTDESWDLYQYNLPLHNFRQLELNEEFKNGDLILMRLGRTFNPNHIGILIREEGEPLKVLHHVSGRPSYIEVYSEILKTITVGVWRHGKQDQC
jgi:NlpC/P60 family